MCCNAGWYTGIRVSDEHAATNRGMEVQTEGRKRGQKPWLQVS